MTAGRGGGLKDLGPEPRLRDMPAPRKSRGMIAPLFGVVFAWPYRLGLKGLHRAGFRPWQLTLLSLVANAAIGWLILTGRLFLPGLLLMVAGLLDIFDGGLARLRGEESRWGAFMDSVIDRASDIILFGCIVWLEFGHGPRLTAGIPRAGLLAATLARHVRA